MIAAMPTHSRGLARSPSITTDATTNSAIPPCPITATIDTGALDTAIK